jgi:hypothetical protein
VLAKGQRHRSDDAVLLLDAENGAALSEEPVLVTGEEMNAAIACRCRECSIKLRNPKSVRVSKLSSVQFSKSSDD